MHRRIFLILIFSLLIAKVAVSQEEKFVYDSQDKRDPFLSLVSSEGYILDFGFDLESLDLTLEGVIYDPHGESLAIMNGRVVRKGDYIGNFKIEEIYQDKVIFRSNEGIMEIKLEKEE